MFEFYKNTLCVYGGCLYEHDNIMSKTTYQNLYNRGKIQVLRRGGRYHQALVSYMSIPERFKKLIIAKVGDPLKTMSKNDFVDMMIYDEKAANHFNQHTFDNGRALPESRKKEYLANAIILNAISKRLEMTKSVNGKVKNLWANLPADIETLPRHLYPHSLPKNPTTLKRRYTAFIASEPSKTYPKIGYDSLIHGNYSNSHAEKINDKAKVWIISRWADRVMVCATLGQLLIEYNIKAEEKGWSTLKDENTLYKYLNKSSVKHLWYGHRYGDGASKEKYAYKNSTKMPTLRDSLWYSDGTKMNLYFQYRTEDNKVKMGTCQVYEVMDAYSEVFLGYHISKTENFEAQYLAYKMAIQTAEHRPYEIRFDGQGGHKKLIANEFFNKVCRLAIKTTPHNGSSKSIEHAFGRFQTQIMRKTWFFTGQNITAKKTESKARMEFILANKDKLPTLEEAKAAYVAMRKEWNQGLHYQTKQPRLNMYLESVNPKTPTVGIWEMVDMFWMLRPKPVTCTAMGISFRENKKKYEFMVHRDDNLPDVDWLRENIDKKFRIKFDPEDMGEVYLYEEDSLGLRFVAKASTKLAPQRNIQEQEDFEAKYFHDVKALSDKSRVKAYDKMDAMLESEGRSDAQQGFKSPKLLGIKKQKGKVANSIGQVRKKESNMMSIDDAELDPDFKPKKINIHKRLSRTLSD